MRAKRHAASGRGAPARLLVAVPALLMLAAGVPITADELTPQERTIVLSLSPLELPARDPTNAVSGNCPAIDFGRNHGTSHSLQGVSVGVNYKF